MDNVTLLRMAMSDPLVVTRGRPRAGWLSRSDVRSFNYLARISMKNGIEASQLLQCVLDAWVKGESSFDDVSIKLRQMTGDQGFFLMVRDGTIMAQVKLTLQLLKYLGRIDIRSLRFEATPPAKRGRVEPEDLMIKDLNSQTSRFNLTVKVTEKSAPRIVFSRWGGEFLLSTATVADRSGAITLPLWNRQVSMVSVGDLLHIGNARLRKFRGELQVRVGKSSTLRTIQK